jgi:hypothetical protein
MRDVFRLWRDPESRATVKSSETPVSQAAADAVDAYEAAYTERLNRILDPVDRHPGRAPRSDS